MFRSMPPARMIASVVLAIPLLDSRPAPTSCRAPPSLCVVLGSTKWWRHSRRATASAERARPTPAAGLVSMPRVRAAALIRLRNLCVDPVMPPVRRAVALHPASAVLVSLDTRFQMVFRKANAVQSEFRRVRQKNIQRRASSAFPATRSVPHVRALPQIASNVPLVMSRPQTTRVYQHAPRVKHSNRRVFVSPAQPARRPNMPHSLAMRQRIRSVWILPSVMLVRSRQRPRQPPRIESAAIVRQASTRMCAA